MATASTDAWRSFADGVSLPELVRYLREGVYVMDADGRVLDANPVALGMFGAARITDLATYRVRDRRRDAATWRTELEALTRDGAVREFMREIIGADDRVHVVLDTCYARGEPDAPLFHGVLVDLSTPADGPETEGTDAAARDRVTGAFTPAFVETLDAAWRGEPARPAGVCVVTLDDLDEVARTQGRDAANRACVRMTRFLWRHSRAHEPVVRMDDARFALLLPDTGGDGVETVGRRLQLAALRTAPLPFHLGWATRLPGESCSALIARAGGDAVPVRVVERAFEPPRRR
jgi:GGDEF domain-containing protein